MNKEEIIQENDTTDPKIQSLPQEESNKDNNSYEIVPMPSANEYLILILVLLLNQLGN